jgi:hypothetical protein
MLSTALGVEPRRAGPVPLERRHPLGVSIGEADVTAAAVAQVRPAPVRAARGDAAAAGRAVARVMDDPAAGFLRRLWRDTFSWVGGVDRLTATVGLVNESGGAAHCALLEWGIFPDAGPVAAAETEVGGVVVRGSAKVVNQLLSLERLTGAAKCFFCFLIRKQIVEPRRSVLLAAHKREGPGEAIAIVATVHFGGERQLLDIVEAVDFLPLSLGLGQRRQQQGGQDGNDSNNHQQLDQREGAAMSHNSERS